MYSINMQSWHKPENSVTKLSSKKTLLFFCTLMKCTNPHKKANYIKIECIKFKSCIYVYKKV